MRVVGANEGLLECQKRVHLSTESNNYNPQEMDTRLIRSPTTTLDTEQDVSSPREYDLVSGGQNVHEPHQSHGLGVSGEPVRSMATVPDPNSPYVPDCESAAAQTDGRKFSHEDLINMCPHGTRLPVQ